MKYKTTAKAIREGAMNPRCAGYCDLQHLLTNHSPVAYTCGVYGWNFDVYKDKAIQARINAENKYFGKFKRE